jgi:hypothetical protein
MNRLLHRINITLIFSACAAAAEVESHFSQRLFAHLRSFVRVTQLPWLMFAAVRFYSATGNGLNAALRCRSLLPLRFAACLVRWKVRDHFAFLFGSGSHDFSGWFVLPIF